MYNLKYLKKIRFNEKVPLKLPKDFKFMQTPFRHQVVTFIYGLYHKDLAILSTMGTGKTYCAISIARYWMQQGEAKKVLVVCPTSVLNNWVDEVEMFSEHKALVLHSTIREDRLALFKKSADFYIINYEATIRYLKQLLKLNPDIVIFDESSRVANPKAKQTQACMKIAEGSKYRYILNGTPISNKPLDLWSQFYVLDFGETLYDSYRQYRQAFFSTIKMRTRRGRHFSVYKISNKHSMNLVGEMVAKKSIRYMKEECVADMPGKTYHTRSLTLPKGSRKLYNDVFEYAKLEIAKMGQNISADIKLTKFVKALQVTSGYLKTDTGDFLQLKNNPKLEELKGIIEEVVPESAMVIWCKYLHTIKIVEDMVKDMGFDSLTIKGEVKDKSGVAKLFQETSIEDIPIIICQIRSGGVGINLHKASYAVFVENEWRLQDRYQAEDRIHRIGQERPCTYIDLVVEDSIDELILQSVKTNKDIAEYILAEVR